MITTGTGGLGVLRTPQDKESQKQAVSLVAPPVLTLMDDGGVPRDASLIARFMLSVKRREGR